MAAPTFASYEGQNIRACKGCGKVPEKNKGQVSILLRELGPGGKVAGAKHLASTSRSLCEGCAVTAYEQAIKALG